MSYISGGIMGAGSLSQRLKDPKKRKSALKLMSAVMFFPLPLLQAPSLYVLNKLYFREPILNKRAKQGTILALSELVISMIFSFLLELLNIRIKIPTIILILNLFIAIAVYKSPLKDN